ncbi:TatD DNase family protein [Mariniphaga anaerophila]|uniref:TatD DNase family protein n=1 Tax=Mariniphaga anaerophila TaxID=1484053 RepID=A0A1M5F8R6_9BACT|nr:TatD family hydrolase [Mariniphaga anaerophila]SHF87461.1 TatD DNase family protein [Mariniphaga anaerophila]
MVSTPFIDIHTHNKNTDPETVTVFNLEPGDPIHVFAGKNFYSVGLHPWKIKSEKDDDERMLMMEDALDLDHVIFVGECGLDKVTGAGFDEQMRAFSAQAFMAEEYGVPLIIHCVKAWNEVVELHKKNRPSVPWIFHGYNGSVELTRQLLDKNFLFSFGEALFRENGKAIESIKLLPLEKIFFETDMCKGPVEDMYKRGAELKNIPVENLKEAVWENFNRIENVNFKI